MFISRNILVDRLKNVSSTFGMRKLINQSDILMVKDMLIGLKEYKTSIESIFYIDNLMALQEKSKRKIDITTNQLASAKELGRLIEDKMDMLIMYIHDYMLGNDPQYVKVAYVGGEEIYEAKDEKANVLICEVKSMLVNAFNMYLLFNSAGTGNGVNKKYQPSELEEIMYDAEEAVAQYKPKNVIGVDFTNDWF